MCVETVTAREKEGEGETDREREGEGETDRQTGRETDSEKRNRATEISHHNTSKSRCTDSALEPVYRFQLCYNSNTDKILRQQRCVCSVRKSFITPSRLTVTHMCRAL